MKKVLLCMAVGLATIANAQQFEVTSIQEVKTSDGAVAFHPRFMPDGKTLLVSNNESYDGLALVNISKGTRTELTDMLGAAWCPKVSEDGKTILTRSMNRENFTQNIYALDVESKKLTPIIENIEHVNDINLTRGVAQVAHSGKLLYKTVAAAPIPMEPNTDLLLTNEDLKLVIYQNGMRTVLDPLAGQFGDWDPQYCWASFSPDMTKILFYCKRDAYTCDLDGSNVQKIGSIQSPQWCGNDYVVGMNDEHDGYFNTRSDIVICKRDGSQLQQLTPSSKEIKMFPSVSADGSKIAFHTEEGKIYVMSIKQK